MIIDYPAWRHTNAADVSFADWQSGSAQRNDALISTEARFPGLRVDPASFDGRWPAWEMARMTVKGSPISVSGQVGKGICGSQPFFS